MVFGTEVLFSRPVNSDSDSDMSSFNCPLTQFNCTNREIGSFCEENNDFHLNIFTWIDNVGIGKNIGIT